MYCPEHFHETDLNDIKRLVQLHPLALCIARSDHDFELNHLPMLWRENALIGHIARANQMHNILENGCKAAFVFSGENSYISPNWYPSKAEEHKVVPTWNYQVVHIHGALTFSHKDKDKRAAVALLTREHEAKVNGKAAWALRDAAKDYLQDMLDNIVAIRLDIERIQAKSKLGQNKQDIDFKAVMQKMQEKSLMELAASMRKKR